MAPPERLTPLDASFLYLERPVMHMHVAALSVFDPSTRPGGRLRFEDVEAVMASRMHMLPRFRHKVRTVPLNLGLPVWVDDPHFDLDFHLRRAAVPSPGGRHELTEYVQRILSRPLDRTKPLWEMYVIEGLEDGHVATLLKVHHAMIDGISGMHLAAALWDLSAEAPPIPSASRWDPEPEPSPEDLVRGTWEEATTHPVRALTDAVEFARRQPAIAALNVGTVLSGVRAVLDMGARPVSPFDVEIGPNRRFAIADAPLQRLKDVKNALGGTVNDVVLTAVGGALHELLRGRKEPTRGRSLRAMVPVSVRAAGDATIGNRVAPALVDIPVGAMGAKRRLAEVRKGTEHLKSSMMALSADSIISLGAYAPGGLLAAAARAASLGPFFNLVVSNIPGPQQPMYFAGARLVASYPSLPLNRNSALSIACSSLAGTMAFGVTGDWDAMPDVQILAVGIERSLEELAKAAGAQR
jgi:diacylglycerol O-acyltransferase